jgi:hypothetical protein
MGYFPYDCIYCGGGYNRCGANHEDEEDEDHEADPCTGGQGCWEDACVLYPHRVLVAEDGLPPLDLTTLDQFYSDTYDGYGRIEDDVVKIGTRTIRLVIDDEDLDHGDSYADYVVACKIACQSCHEAKWTGPKDPVVRKKEFLTAELAVATKVAKDIAATIRTLNKQLVTARTKKKETAAQMAEITAALAALGT